MAKRSTEAWNLSCPDWAVRIREGRSLIPDLPIFEDEAEMAVSIFDTLRLPDVPGLPLLRDAAGDWYRDIVRVALGSRNPATNERMVREVFAMVPKGQSKTSYSAGLMVTALAMNLRPRAELLFVGPTQAISDLAFTQATGMVENDDALSEKFRVREHLKEIVDKDETNQSKLKVKTFDLNILTGPKPVVVLLDEIHLLGRNAHAAKVMRQIRGGLEKNSESLLIIITTQSDEPPAGVFRDELHMARRIRDGKFPQGRMLPILYEFPEEIAKEPAKWQDPTNWPMVLPNLGRSMRLDSLIADWETERLKGERAIRIWASQHLNIEIGIGLKTDAWPGAEHWAKAEDATITGLDALIDRCELIVVGIDGGGLDDLFGLTAIGREKQTRHWLSWSHAWAHNGVLTRRQTIAALLEQFAAEGLVEGLAPPDLTIVDDELGDLQEIVAIVKRIADAGLLHSVALDMEGPYGEFIDALAEIDVTPENGQVLGIGQGYKLMNAIKSVERKLANGTFRHAPSRLMNWCVTNLKIEATATAIRATKQNAGDDKIDPAMALFDAATVLVTNPEGVRSVYDQLGDIDRKATPEPPAPAPATPRRERFFEDEPEAWYV